MTEKKRVDIKENKRTIRKGGCLLSDSKLIMQDTIREGWNSLG
jgi:hypothetical protein